MENFVLIIILVFGILQIILFFKMWGMTNDVDKIAKKVVVSDSRDLVWEIRKSLLLGDKKKVEDMLFNALVDEIKREFRRNDRLLFSREVAAIKADYEKYYKQIDLELPECIQAINTMEDIQAIFSFDA